MSYAVALFDLQPLVAYALKALSIELGTFTIVGETGSKDKLTDILKSGDPAILLADVDLSRSAGVDLIGGIRKEFPELKIVLFVTRNHEQTILTGLKSSVAGLLMSECSCSEVHTCLNMVASNRFYFTPLASDSLARQVNRITATPRASAAVGKLTPMECRIMNLLAENKTSREISSSLFISLHTVFTHRKNIASKLGLRGKYALMKFAMDHKVELLSLLADRTADQFVPIFREGNSANMAPREKFVA